MDASVPGRPTGGLGHYLRDVVYGAIDGVVTTLAVIAGVTGAALSPTIAIVLGLANLGADGISMGASNYLALKSELEQTGRSVREERPVRHGAATFAAFVLAGAVPLLAYLAPFPVEPFPAAAVLAAITLFVVGSARSSFVGRSRVRCGLEMLVIGAVAGAAAFFIGMGVERVLV